MSEYRTEIIIPTYCPDESFPLMIRKLLEQTAPPEVITVINTDEKKWESVPFDRTLFEADPGRKSDGTIIRVFHVSPSEFDHGRTRAEAADRSGAQFLIFMTQDAMPADPFLIENLLKAYSDEDENKGCREHHIAAVYARQLPGSEAGMLERYTRSFNYGSESVEKTEKDLQRLGIKTFFCSNVCCAYRKEVYDRLGGFVRKAIFNEDMIYAGNAVRNGYSIVYASEARVIHSHDYSAFQQFHRNFDLGVSQADHPEIFTAASSEREGIRLIRNTAAFVCREGKPYLVFRLLWNSAWKYLGYFLGKRYRKLPEGILLKCTGNRAYWNTR